MWGNISLTMRLLITLTLILAFTLSTCALLNQTTKQNNSYKDFDLKVKKFTLKNGLRLLVHENRLLPIVSFRTFVEIGARHESVKNRTTGASHFLEHMVTKSTKNYPVPGTIHRLFNEMGAITNATTSYDVTTYIEDLPVEHLNQLIKINADRMKNLVISPPIFENERKVIFEERKMRVENSPFGKFGYTIRQDVFAQTPYGGSLIGSIEDLTRLTPKQVFQFYKNFYSPDNMIIVVAGDVDAGTIYEKISRAFGDMKPSSPKIKKYRKQVNNPELYRHRAVYGREVKIYGSNPHPIFALVYPGFTPEDHRLYAIKTLASVSMNTGSSWFHQQYIKSKNPLAKSIGSYHSTLKFNGYFGISGELLPGTNLEQFKKRLLADTQAICDRDDVINERNLQKIKKNLMLSYYNTIKTNGGMAEFLGTTELRYGDYRHYKKQIAAYGNITVSQVKKICRETFQKKNNYIFFSQWNKHPKGDDKP